MFDYDIDAKTKNSHSCFKWFIKQSMIFSRWLVNQTYAFPS